MERVLGPRLDHQTVTWLLERHGSPAALRRASRPRLVEVIRPRAPRMAGRLINEVFDALDEQTVVVPGTGTLKASFWASPISKTPPASVQQKLPSRPERGVLATMGIRFLPVPQNHTEAG